MRVVELGTSPAPAMQRLCSRCRGASEHTAQFCRFCGASLADAQAVPIQAAANPIAATPGPPAAAPAPFAARAPVAPTAPPSAPTAAPAPAPVAPAPAPATATTRARLVLIARDGNEGPSYPLGEATDIGRTEGNVVIAEDRYISPRHARVAMRGGAFFVRDLESTNGIFVRIPFPRGATEGGAGGAGNALKAADSEQVLADQDLFLVGQQVLRFEVVKHADEGFGVASENGTLLFGTPAAPRYARLSQRTVEGVVRDVFHVKKPETVIGRESGDIVFSDDAFLSRRHAVIRVHGVASVGGPRSFTIADLGSSNGTFLQVREEVRLRHGDHFRIGQQLFRFDT
ncbi:MAG: FHA domain-containing protein [Polyangiaceae bacterium]